MQVIYSHFWVSAISFGILSFVAGSVLGKRWAQKPYDELCKQLQLQKMELELKIRFLAQAPSQGTEETTQTVINVKELRQACKKAV